MVDREIAAHEYRFSRSKTLRITGIAFVIGASLTLPFFLDQSGQPWRNAALLIGGILTMALALAMGRRFFGSEPALMLLPAGVRLPAVTNAIIPWTAIVDIERIQMRRSELLRFVVDPVVARNLPRRGPARLSPRSSTFAAALSLLEGDPSEITARSQAAWRAAHAGAAAPIETLQKPALATVQPWLVYALLGLLIIIYICELAFAVNANHEGAPSVLTLAYSGGSIGSRVWRAGEWWRLFTAPLLHANLIHIACNGIVLWVAGTSLERLIGWRWLAAIFAVSALCGSVASLFINAPNIVAVGASGGIMGLLGALFVMSFRLVQGRWQLQVRAIRIVLPALLPFSSTGHGMTIDYAAHGGGLIGGVIVAFILLKLWPRDQSRLPFGGLGAGIAAAFFVIAAGSLAPILHLREALG